MSLTRQVRAACSRCGEENILSAYYSVNVAEDPELKARVKDGSLFMWECPHCGTRNLLRTEVLYHDPDKKLMVWLLPGDSREMDSLGGKLEEIAESLPDYTLRRTEEVGSLIEKVNIRDAGLDDMVIEICKYVTRVELAEKAGDNAEAIMKAPFKFYMMQGADNQLIFTFPLDGKMQGVPVGFSIYEDSRGILARNPAVAESAKGFAKIDADWLSQHFR